MTSTERYLVISGDCHAGPPLPGFRAYFDPRYRDGFDAYCRARPNAAAAEAALRGDLEAMAGALGAFMKKTGASEQAARGFSERAMRMTAGLFDSQVRDACLDDEGIAGEVIFPDGFIDNHPPYSDMMETETSFRRLGTRAWPYELRMAGARAYNRWLADFCSESPLRRAGIAVLPPAEDVAASVAELRSAREAGLRGFLIPPLDAGLPGYHDAWYEPLWSAAADLGMPVHVHGGNGVAPDAATTYGTREPLASVLHFTECAFFDRRPLWHFIWGGVFERHPGLRLVMAEGLAHWVPEELLRLDEMYGMWNLQSLRDELPRSPSDYWKRQCFLTASFISRAEAEMRHALHLPNLLWGSDYPHPEGTWPYTNVCLQHAFAGLPEDEVRGILGTHALALYGFEFAALRALADRIGPRPGDVAQPLVERPSDYVGMGLR